MKPQSILVLAIVVVLLSSVSYAGMYVVDTGEPTTSSGMVIGTNTPPADPGQVISLEFLLLSPTEITAIYPHLGRLEEGLNLDIYLTTEIGETATSSDVIANWTIWGIPGSDSFSGIWYPIELTTPLSLPSGSYYLTYVTGTDEHVVIRWDAPVEHGRDFWASGNEIFPPASSFNETTKNFALRIEGTVVPTPTAVTLSILGLSTAGWKLRKKTKE